VQVEDKHLVGSVPGDTGSAAMQAVMRGMMGGGNPLQASAPGGLIAQSMMKSLVGRQKGARSELRVELDYDLKSLGKEKSQLDLLFATYVVFESSSSRL